MHNLYQAVTLAIEYWACALVLVTTAGPHWLAAGLICCSFQASAIFDRDRYAKDTSAAQWAAFLVAVSPVPLLILAQVLGAEWPSGDQQVKELGIGGIVLEVAILLHAAVVREIEHACRVPGQ
jgi:hypothetical protein